MKEDYRDVDVPPWAMKLILGEEDFPVQKQEEWTMGLQENIK